MECGRRSGFSATISCVAVWLLATVVLVTNANPATAQTNASTGKPGFYTIALFVSSQRGTVAPVIDAIRHFTNEKIRELNDKGGIHGRKVRLLYLDDDEEVEQTIKNVDTALEDENLIAMIGIWNSTRGAAVVERVGRSGVPLISEMSVNSLFADYKNIFTLTRAVDDETRVFRKFVENGFKRPAFVGLDGDLYTKSYQEALEDIGGDVSLVASHWIPSQDELDDEAADRAIADLKQQNPDLLCLSIGSARGAAFVKKMIDAGLEIPIFLGAGSAVRILRVKGAKNYASAIYQITDGVPYVDNERLAQLARQDDFVGAGRGYGRDAIGYGVRYADILAMVVETANTSPRTNVVTMKKHIGESLRRYEAGKKIYRGLWQDWSFTPNRASAEIPLMIWRPPGHKEIILSPIQYLETGSGLINVPVLYVNLDMIRVFEIDSNEQTFQAEFYFAMSKDANINIDSIEFTNAYRSQVNNEPLVNIREIHGGTAAAGFSSDVKLYKISGRFRFDPDLANYPLDQQQFSISFQPASTASPFFIQPPKPALRDRDFTVEGWQLIDEYVGSNQDIISTIQNYASDKNIITFYKFNYTWIMQRLALDYYLRVVLPLLFILVVVYFSIFIPDSRFDSIMAIQVTGLLSTIALYLAIPKLDAETATLSDQIFLFAEFVIALMIGLSIWRTRGELHESPSLANILTFVQVIIFPAMVAGLFGYILIKSSDGSLSLPSFVGAFFTLNLPQS